MTQTTVLLDGLAFGEGPRWHDNKLWLSDMHGHRVLNVDLDGHVETVVEVPTWPSGLGWLPDGRLLIVSMTDRRLLRLDPDGLKVVADLSELATYLCNDMVVDDQGRAYIGNFGFDLQVQPLTAKPAELVLVMPDGTARLAAGDLAFPNGTVITPDGKTLIVAETFASRLTAFDIGPDGSLSGRRTWAQFDELGFDLTGGRVHPDGICLDAEGSIWAASPSTNEVLRVCEGGRITDRLQGSQLPFACMLGGPSRRTLFVLTAQTHNPGEARTRACGRVEMIEVDVPGAGLP